MKIFLHPSLPLHTNKTLRNYVNIVWFSLPPVFSHTLFPLPRARKHIDCELCGDQRGKNFAEFKAHTHTCPCAAAFFTNHSELGEIAQENR